jgi:hypothetical protein
VNPLRLRVGLRSETDEVRFVVAARTAVEDSLLANVQRLARMPWDSLDRPTFLAALLQYAGDRVAQDVRDPLLPLLLSQMVGTARAVGYPPDSVTTNSLNALRLVVGQNRRFEPAGVIAVAPIRYERPAFIPEVARLLGESLGGDVVRAISRGP